MATLELTPPQTQHAIMANAIRALAMDAVQAANWFSKAATQGMPDAALEYGVLVFRGEGVQKDQVLGAKWLLIAANHGNAVAQNRMAKLYALGLGVKADAAEAAKWNILAKAGGRADAELDDAQSKLETSILKEAETRAAAFKPMAAPAKN